MKETIEIGTTKQESRFIIVSWVFIFLAIINAIFWWVLPGDYTVEVLICFGLIIISWSLVVCSYPVKKVKDRNLNKRVE